MAHDTSERQGEAFELDERLTVVGRKLEVGDPAPDVPLETLDASTGVVQTVRPSDWAGEPSARSRPASSRRSKLSPEPL